MRCVRYCYGNAYDVDAAHWTREHAADRIVAAAEIRENFIEENCFVFAVISGCVGACSECNDTKNVIFCKKCIKMLKIL